MREETIAVLAILYAHLSLSTWHSYLWEIQNEKNPSITSDPPCAYPPLAERSTNIGMA